MKRNKATWGGRMVLAVALLCAATPAAAQVDASRMFRSVFIASDSERTGLLLSLSLAEGYGDSPEGYLVSGDADGPRGLYTDFIPRVGYRFVRGRHSIGISGRSVIRANEEDSFIDLGNSVGVGVQSEFGRNALRVEQTVYTQPYYTFNGIPSLTDPTLGSIPDIVNPEEALINRSVFVSNTTGSASRQLGRYLWLTGQYTFRTTSIAGITDNLGGTDSNEHRASMSVGRQIGRHTRLRLGYEYRTAGAVSTGGQPVNLHNLAVGFDRGQALNLGRHTTLTFSVGPALVQTESDTGLTAAGDLMVRHQMGRSWALSGSMRRGLVYADGFERPLMMNGFAVGLDGALGRRVTVRAGYGASQGQNSLSALSGHIPTDLTSKSLRTGVQFAISRYFGAFAEYWHFQQSYGEDPSSLSADDQAGIRVGVLFKMPMFTQPERGEQ
jgi:hypothetical protein